MSMTKRGPLPSASLPTFDLRRFGGGAGASTAANDAAFTAAIAAVGTAGGGRVVLPAGIVNISAPIVVNQWNCEIVGQGPGATTLQQTGVSHGIQFTRTPADNYIQRWRIAHMTIKGAGVATSTGSGIHHYIDAATYISNAGVIDNVVVNDFNRAVYLWKGDSCDVRRLYQDKCNIGSTIGGNAQGTRFEFESGSYITGNGVEVYSGGVELYPGDFSGLGFGGSAYGIYIEGTGSVVTIMGGNFESMKGAACIYVGTNAKVFAANTRFLKGTGTDSPPIHVNNARFSFVNLSVSEYTAATIRKLATQSVVQAMGFPQINPATAEVTVEEYSTGSRGALYPATQFMTRPDASEPGAAAGNRLQIWQKAARDAVNSEDGMYLSIQDKSSGTAAYSKRALHKVIEGTGSPESVVAARVGTLYVRTDGGAATTLYVKESGTGNTGWVAK